MNNLKNNRKKLNSIDKDIKRLLIERFSLSVEIGNFKKENGIAIYDPNREGEIFKTFEDIEDSDLKTSVLETYKKILEESKKLQKNL